MHYLNLVRKTYQEAIALKQMPSDLRSALKSQERMPKFLENLAKELETVQAGRIKKGKTPYQEKTIKDTIYDFVDMFIITVETEANNRMKTDLQKMIDKQKEDERKDLEKTASGQVSGDYEEIFKEGGITTTEDRSVL